MKNLLWVAGILCLTPSSLLIGCTSSPQGESKQPAPLQTTTSTVNLGNGWTATVSSNGELRCEQTFQSPLILAGQKITVDADADQRIAVEITHSEYPGVLVLHVIVDDEAAGHQLNLLKDDQLTYELAWGDWKLPVYSQRWMANCQSDGNDVTVVNTLAETIQHHTSGENIKEKHRLSLVEEETIKLLRDAILEAVTESDAGRESTDRYHFSDENSEDALPIPIKYGKPVALVTHVFNLKYKLVILWSSAPADNGNVSMGIQVLSNSSTGAPTHHTYYDLKKLLSASDVPYDRIAVTRYHGETLFVLARTRSVSPKDNSLAMVGITTGDEALEHFPVDGQPKLIKEIKSEDNATFFSLSMNETWAVVGRSKPYSLDVFTREDFLDMMKNNDDYDPDARFIQVVRPKDDTNFKEQDTVVHETKLFMTRHPTTTFPGYRVYGGKLPRKNAKDPKKTWLPVPVTSERKCESHMGSIRRMVSTTLGSETLVLGGGDVHRYYELLALQGIERDTFPSDGSLVAKKCSITRIRTPKKSRLLSLAQASKYLWVLVESNKYGSKPSYRLDRVRPKSPTE